MRILIIDNFDSFTYNLVDEFKKLECEVKIYRNNISMALLEKVLDGYKPELIVISPGPSRPRDAGICIDMIRRYQDIYPMLGICLGHQCMVEALGGVVSKARLPVHGKKSRIKHNNSRIFSRIPNPFYAGRYHSLYGSEIKGFEVIAHADGMPMAIQKGRMFGLQFHPESILTAHGSMLLRNILGALR